ncbi:SDR family NAD(P)-dependent oxidoreductase [Streptomyces fumanus]|uniref:SDR family NAD(P)-dependent oxidoreductase n=1 Tax=Streptomyces fumanus TaxID=67302 RepID=UPI0033C60AAB
MNSSDVPSTGPALAPLAIIGIGCRYPGGVHDPRSFWELLATGRDAIVDIPADRWHAESFYDRDPATPGRMFVRQGGFLTDPIDRFDAAFFGISPREAAALDPQQRLLLEVTWEALENAGIPPSRTAGNRVGAYIGGFTFDAAMLQLSEANRQLVGPATPTGVSMTMLAARLAYFFDWRGPALTMDTACSSSLVAFHQACVALTRGECDLAVAGGVNVMGVPATTTLMAKGQFLSPDSRCKSFDHRANGYVRSEGAGLVLLKPLAAALRDGDRVHAVVRGTAVNQDGRTPGIQVPSGEAQRAVIRQACRVGGVDPLSVRYFEAHGTGTAVGDPIEATAIGDVLNGSDRTHLIGSVKSNIGHTEAAAGVAGVIKAALCLHHGAVPPNLHFERPNPRIPFDRLPLRVPTELTPFPEQDGPRRAGVNSFGVGGTNAHAVLEHAPGQPAEDTDPDDGSPQVLPLSARSPEALHALAEAYASLMDEPNAPALRRTARAAARNREHHPVRTFVVAADPAEAAGKLRLVENARRRDRCDELAFVYTGMGPQWWGMGRELLLDDPRFAAVVAECDEILASFGLSITEELLRPEAESRLTETLYAQVANFVVQTGLTAIWRDWGIEPTMIVGHSVGEVAAAYAAGVYTLQDALTISVQRASLQAGLAGLGVMAAVDLSADAVLPHLVDGVSIAAINSANATTLAGDQDAMDQVTAALRAVGASVRPLRVEVAYHSHQMDRIHEPLLAALHGIRPRTATIPLFSTVLGDRVDGTEMDADYWWRNVRQPVRFADALHKLLALAPGAIMEIGPHPVLAASIDEALTERGSDAVRLAAQLRGHPQRRQLGEALGGLYAAGVDPDWERVHPGPREHLDLPLYPWQRERHWVESTASRQARLGVDGPRLAGRPIGATNLVRDVELSPAAFPYLVDHRIGSTAVFPGTGYLEAALALFPDEEPCVLTDVVFHHPLALAPQAIATLRSGYDPQQRLITLHSRDRDDAEWTLHTQARHPDVVRPRPPRRQTSTREQLTRSLPALGHDEIYRLLRDRTDLDYGPAFRRISRLWVRAETGEVFAELDIATLDRRGYRLHPAALDASLHAMLAGALAIDDSIRRTYIPAELAELRFHRPMGRRLWLHGRGRLDTAAGQFDCDVTLYTDDGEVAAEVIGLRSRALPDEQTEQPLRSEDLYYEHVWRPEPTERGSAEGTWVVIGSRPEAADLVRGLREDGGDVLHLLSPEYDRIDPKCRGVVCFNDPQAPGDAACSAVTHPLRLVQNLPSVPLFLITSGAQSVTADDATTDPFAAALWGFGRVVNAEYPQLRCRVIDLDSPAGVDALVAELTREDGEEVALRGGVRHVRRIEHADARSGLHHVAVPTERVPVRLVARDAGAGGLGFTAIDRRAPEPTEVEIEVSHVGLNFKDVLKVTGLLTAEAMEGSHSQETLGMECSGTVVRVGDAVSDLSVGDEVFAHGRDLFRSHVTLDQVRVARRPATMSLAQAASLFPAITAYQAVVRLAGVRPGERVLVHAGAGGVGLAAVRIARSLGAEVYATAGSAERRDFLRGEGVAGVADSRSTSFADDILALTGGEGVDVVINSLSGEFLHRSLELLRPFGRFIEVGKTDIAAGRSLRLAPFQRGLSFHAFDHDQMMRLRPEVVQDGMRALADCYDQRLFDPLPVTEVPAGQVETAVRAMAHGGHIGKIVIRFTGETVRVPASSVSTPLIDTDGTYVITGGLGGLGLASARWLAGHGAAHLVLIGRRGIATDEARRAVTELEERGVEVRVERADVVDRRRIREVLDLVRATMPPIKGVFHTAADFDDALLSDLDADRLITATGPKADGAWNLHLETRADHLDHFVLFSSFASQLGSAITGAYATANEFLNALARYRHGRGLVATSVNWGMVDEVGAAASRSSVENVLRINGHLGISPARVMAELETLLRTGTVEGSVAGVDWRRWAQANPQLRHLPRYQNLVPAGALDSDRSTSVPQLLREATPEERVALLPDLVTPLVEKVTGLSEEQVRSGQPVDVDSLAGVELRVLLQNELGVAVPAVRLQRNLTLDGLTTILADELGQAASGPTLSLTDLTTHEFVSSDGLTVYGHLSLPAGPGPFPAVVVCTSGSGGALDDQGRYAQISEHAPLRAAGFAVFTVDHRGTPGHGPEHAARVEMGGRDVDDVLAAARHLAAMPEIDAARISVTGTSRGAYAALLAVAREPARWQRAVLIMGLYRPDPDTVLPVNPDIAPADLRSYFADPARQPLQALAGVSTPLLLIHGDIDEVVPIAQAQEVADRAEHARLVTVAGLGHDNEYTSALWADLWPRITGFLDHGEA